MAESIVKTALVTGANRGLGYETARQLVDQGWTVWVSARSIEKAKAASQSLGKAARPIDIDVTSAASVEVAFEDVGLSGDGLSVLVNNAGIDYDSDQRPASADLERVQAIFQTNFFGAWRVASAAAPLLGQQPHSVIVNVSSGAGSLADMGAGTPGYSTSKTALNALTRKLAADLKQQGTLVNSVCPGWVATDMGGGGRLVAEGAAGIVWAATLTPGGPTSGFFRDGKPIEW
ncbi:SDR family NAD(P)-dependent oxidoreductase [Roseovarius sp. C03]|uniref:SDR family NAD(P)-dependent oxidoreductase n=1 Tax=Roseovarius sp. C03 TaxID=3449222 RepID=UPI003EDBD619